MTVDLHAQVLHRRSLEIILNNQQASGAYLACPTMPDYQFSWFRDGAFIAYALTLDGHWANVMYRGDMNAQWNSASRFHSWCAQMINQRAAALERSIASVQTGRSLIPADLLNSH